MSGGAALVELGLGRLSELSLDRATYGQQL
jgi:hypothetical protein